jgi:hypothetical protein
MRTTNTLPTNGAFFERYATLIPTLYKLGFLAQIVSALTEISIIYSIVYGSVKDFAPSLAPAIGAAGALIGTAFIEIGLRKFTPFSVRAILHRRFTGLDLAMTVFIFLSTAVLLSTSGLLSFKNSKTIVEATAPPPEQRTTNAAEKALEAGRVRATEEFQRDSTNAANALNSAIATKTAHFNALIELERVKLAQLEGKERRTGQRLSTAKAAIKTRIAGIEAERSGELAALSERAAAELTKIRSEQKNALERLETAFEREKSNVEGLNAAAIAETKGRVDKYGSGLGWFTVVCLLVFVLSVTLDEIHRKGAGIIEAVQPTQYDFSPGVWEEAANVAFERINYLFRSRIKQFADATPAPPLPLAPPPLYDVRQIEQPRFVLQYEPGTGGVRQIFLNAPTLNNTPAANDNPANLEHTALSYLRAAEQLKGAGLEEPAREMEVKATDVLRLYLGPTGTPAAIEELRAAIIQHLNGKGPNPFEHLHRRQIGFNKPSPPNGERLTVNVEEGNTRLCSHCGNPFTCKHWNAKYCSDNCRVASWENRTGAKFRKGRAQRK